MYMYNVIFSRYIPSHPDYFNTVQTEIKPHMRYTHTLLFVYTMHTLHLTVQVHGDRLDALCVHRHGPRPLHQPRGLHPRRQLPRQIPFSLQVGHRQRYRNLWILLCHKNTLFPSKSVKNKLTSTNLSYFYHFFVNVFSNIKIFSLLFTQCLHTGSYN